MRMLCETKGKEKGLFSGLLGTLNDIITEGDQQINVILGSGKDFRNG